LEGSDDKFNTDGGEEILQTSDTHLAEFDTLLPKEDTNHMTEELESNYYSQHISSAIQNDDPEHVTNFLDFRRGAYF